MRYLRTNKAMLTFLAAILCIWCSHSECAEEENFTNDVRQLLFQHPAAGEPSKAAQLRSYARYTGNSMEDVESVLLGLLSAGLKDISAEEDRTAYLRCDLSTWVLGELRCARAIPSLTKLLEVTTDHNMRQAALMARVTIGGEDLLPYAREVFCNRKRYCDHCRFLLYRQLAPYVGLDDQRPLPSKKGGPPSEHDPPRQSVVQFMRNAIYEDITNVGGTMKLDEILCLADPQYRTSHEREDVLERLAEVWLKIEEGKGSSSARTYPTEQLKILRATPADERTHVEIERMETEETVKQNTGE